VFGVITSRGDGTRRCEICGGADGLPQARPVATKQRSVADGRVPDAIDLCCGCIRDDREFERRERCR